MSAVEEEEAESEEVGREEVEREEQAEEEETEKQEEEEQERQEEAERREEEAERREIERDVEVDEEELQREAVRLARWRMPEGFGERREVLQDEGRQTRCCGRWLRVIRRGEESRRLEFVEWGLGSEEVQRARQDILNMTYV